MTTTANIHQQIDWLDHQIRSMKRNAPAAIQAGRLTEEHATHNLACASAALQTLSQLRGIVRGELLPPLNYAQVAPGQTAVTS